MQKIFQNPDGAPQPIGAYSQAVRIETGDTAIIFISGQVSNDLAGNLVGKGDVVAQTEQIFKNLEAILATNGATFDDVVKMTTFLVDIAARPLIGGVRTKYLTGNLPTSTLVAVSALANPDYLIEIEAVAAVQR
jgi:reactive intermediate/imine deaminase